MCVGVRALHSCADQQFPTRAAGAAGHTHLCLLVGGLGLQRGDLSIHAGELPLDVVQALLHIGLGLQLVLLDEGGAYELEDVGVII